MPGRSAAAAVGFAFRAVASAGFVSGVSGSRQDWHAEDV
jgi:hypothetical protein